MGKGASSRRAHAWARFALPTLRNSAFRDSTSSGNALVRPRIAATVDQEILTGDEAGVDGTQESKIRAELGGIAVALGGICGGAVAPGLVERFAGRGKHAAHVLALRIAVEDAGQQVVDRDVAADGLAREAG